MTIAIIDVETTGLDPLNSRLVAIAASFSRCSSSSPEKRGIVFKVLILYIFPIKFLKNKNFQLYLKNLKIT